MKNVGQQFGNLRRHGGRKVWEVPGAVIIAHGTGTFPIEFRKFSRCVSAGWTKLPFCSIYSLHFTNILADMRKVDGNRTFCRTDFENDKILDYISWQGGFYTKFRGLFSMGVMALAKFLKNLVAKNKPHGLSLFLSVSLSLFLQISQIAFSSLYIFRDLYFSFLAKFQKSQKFRKYEKSRNFQKVVGVWPNRVGIIFDAHQKF